MNPILFAPKDPREAPEPIAGSRRYYARFSQSESLAGPEDRERRAAWFFEAFDAQWFDENREPPTANNWIEFYERALLFVLELQIDLTRFGRFPEFSEFQAADERGDEPDNWYTIFAKPLEPGRTLGEGDIPVLIYFNLYLPGITASLEKIEPANDETSARLRKAVTTSHIPDAQDKDIDTTLGGLPKPDYATVYDVGQGNAIGLCSSHSVQSYFDFGGGVLANAFTFPTALKNFCFSTNPPIVLSHWDFDHWSSANRDAQSLKSTWIAPRQSVGPTHVALMASITTSGRLLLLASTFSARWFSHMYLELCTGKGRNHSGIAMTLSEQPNGAGEQMLFPGDARYTSIASFAVTKHYTSVVAPHHGADMRNRTTPACPSLPHSRLVYSVGAGNSFGHPRHVTRVDHHCNHWRDPFVAPGTLPFEVRETSSRSAGIGPFGHVLLGWTTYASPPATACSGICQLQAAQI